jgi:Protein of unknown function, DUF481
MTARGLLALSLVSAVVATAPAQQGFAVPSNLAPPPSPTFDPPRFAPSPPPTVVDGGGLLPSERPAKVWSGGGELGMNGAEGNSKLFSLRAGVSAKRKTDTNLLSTDFLYTYAKQNDTLTQNQALFNARDEILFPGSPWSLFASTNIEYDRLKAYDFLIGLYGGVGYQVVQSDVIDWRVRAGVGAVRLFGGPNDRWVPELVFGTDFSYKIDDRQSFVFNLDYYPRVDNFAQYRVRARGAYQVILDKASGTTLRLGVQDRFDSNSGPAKQNDLTYFATLGFTF